MFASGIICINRKIVCRLKHQCLPVGTGEYHHYLNKHKLSIGLSHFDINVWEQANRLPEISKRLSGHFKLLFVLLWHWNRGQNWVMEKMNMKILYISTIKNSFYSHIFLTLYFMIMYIKSLSKHVTICRTCSTQFGHIWPIWFSESWFFIWCIIQLTCDLHHFVCTYVLSFGDETFS